MACCKAAGVPVVVSPIWISLARALWGSRGSTAVLTQAVTQGEAAAQPLLEQLRRREMVVQMEHGPINAEGQGDGCWPLNGDRFCRQMIFATNSWLELQALQKRSPVGWGLFRNRPLRGRSLTLSGCRS